MKRFTRDKFSYVFSPFAEAPYKVALGETFVIETLDWVSNQLKTEEDLPKILNSPILQGSQPLMNPITGPVYVEGAEPGDTLVVNIKEVKPEDHGSVWIIPGFGILPDDFSKPSVKVVSIKDGRVIFNDKISYPIRPFPGTIGVAPEREVISTFYNGPYGGNMDVADLTAGTKLYLPVFAKGALFGVGDVHAAQGDGELSTAVEAPADVTLSFDIVKGKSPIRPRFETDKEIGVIVGYRPHIEGLKVALRELITWLAEYGLKPEETYTLCATCPGFTIRICQAYDIRFPQFPPYPTTLRVALLKEVVGLK